MDLPPLWNKTDLSALDKNDTITSNIDPSTISFLSEFLLVPLAFFTPNLYTTVSSPDNGEGFNLSSSTDSGLNMDYGWTSVETVIIRYDAMFTTNSAFPVHSNDTEWGDGEIGFDAAVCVQKYEPWIVEVYNAPFASPSILQIIEKGNGSTSLPPSGDLRGTLIEGTRYLNASGKSPTFNLAHTNGVRQMMKVDYGEDYIPNPIVGPVASPHTSCLLTSIYSTGHFFR